MQVQALVCKRAPCGLHLGHTPIRVKRFRGRLSPEPHVQAPHPRLSLCVSALARACVRSQASVCAAVSSICPAAQSGDQAIVASPA